MTLNEAKKIVLDLARYYEVLESYQRNNQKRILTLDKAEALKKIVFEMEENEKIATVAVSRCAKENGPCWCGCHVSSVMESEVISESGD